MIEVDGKERELTVEEKRRFIKIIVLAMVAIYIANVKQLSSEKKARVEKSLTTKYSKKEGNVIEGINKLTAKIFNSAT